MKMKPNKPAAFLLTTALLFSGMTGLSETTSAFDVSAIPGQEGQSTEDTVGESHISISENDKASNSSDSGDSTTDNFKTQDDTDVDAADNSTQDDSDSDITDTNAQNDVLFAASEVTFETIGDNRYAIYANGQPLIIEASSNINYAKLYLDSNKNGIGEAEEEITAFRSDKNQTGDGINYSEESGGYDLRKSIIYGGAKEGTCQYDTSITLSGPSDSSGNYTVQAIYGGNQSGTLTGNTHVNISGGNIRLAFGGNQGGTFTGNTHVNISGGSVGWSFGGGNTAEINGDTSIHMTGGNASKNMYGGSASGQINGNTSIHIEAGQVSYVFGGNENSGLITGDTNLIFDDNATANGWIYGGGAGYSNDAITEVAGSTNITVNGGTFARNMYGGGGWRGAKVGSSNITVNGGTFNGWIYGGGEETSSVVDNVSITINDGTVSTICASGAGFNNTKAEIKNAEIHLQGGSANIVRTLPNDTDRVAVITGDLSLTLSGDTFSNTELYLGYSENPVNLQNVSVTLSNGKTKLLRLESPVTGKLSISLDHADITDLILLEDTLKDAKEATLSYTDCGSSTGRFGTFVQGISYNYFTDIDNPLLTGSHLNKNKFTSITFRNSYVNYHDDTVSGDDNSPGTCTEKLILDGGTLRVTGNMLTNMPSTVFQNNPLLMRTSGEYEGIHFAENPAGSARLQWMNCDGTGIMENTCDISIAETPQDTPDTTFTAADSEYAIRRDNVSRSDPTGLIWNGTVWYTGKMEELCKCQALDSTLTENLFPLPAGSSSASFTLKDALTGNTNLSSGCPVIGHGGTAPSFTYSVIPEGTTISDAVISGDLLTVSQTGAVHVQVKEDLNGKTQTYDTYVQVLNVPWEDSFQFTKEVAEDISLSFSGNGIEFDTSYSYIWNNTIHKYMDSDSYDMTLEDGTLKFVLKKEYLNKLELGEYEFHTAAYVKQNTNSGKRYDHYFTVMIVQPTKVDNPIIELSEKRYQYDGTLKIPYVTVKHGDTVIPSREYTASFQNNRNVGTATVTITDIEGGNYIVNGTTTYEIINDYHPENGADYVTTPLKNGWTNRDFVITAADNHLLSTGNTVDGKWVKELTRTAETDAGGDSVSFYVKNTETGAISLKATEQYKLDRTDPENYDIQFNENSVKKLIHDVTFGMLFGKTVDIKITAEDALSGIGSISYFLSDTALTEEQVRKTTDWTDGSLFSITAEDTKKFIVYVKVADRAGNLVCFASDGAEFDLTAPDITGVSDNTTYYTTQLVSITDKHPGTVTLNGQNVSGDIILPGNIDKTYVIKATDQAGNESIATITMKPVKNVAAPIDSLTKDTVTSDSQAAINTVMTELDLLLESEHLTEQEKTEIESLRKEAEDLNTQIASANDAADTKEIQAVDGISKDTVSLDDKASLEKARDDLETALEKYGDNYTESEKQAIEDDIARIDESLISIRNAETVTNAIQTLPDADEVSPDDAETEKAAREIEDLLESLTEHEKNLVDTTKLTQVLDALTDYRILEGNNSQWEQDNDQNLIFKANGPVNKFTGILIDDKSVGAENYIVTSGSTVLTLKAAYLDTLSAGTHSLTVLYSDGKTSAVFETHRKSQDNDNPDKPSDDNNTGKPSDNDNTDKPSGSNNTGNSSDNGRPSGDGNTSSRSASARTSDDQNLWLWFVLLLVSGVSAIEYIKLRFFKKVKN